ncbi:putative receptor-like protein kinase At3g47110 [Tasmannia lanceolata]|uniref:putative receptor-like protein kinase At3g47110 n=1 Tax=Tasmannia lanceolata TaxID=3420 RepID=UPI004063FA55
MTNLKLLWSFLLIPSIIFFINILQSQSSSISTPQSGNETDRLALLAFKQTITDDPHGFLSSWNDSLHFCNWNGVTCTHRHHQRVTVLDLNSQSLVGSLSPHLTNLTFLRFMNFTNNNFHGEIPAEIGHLSRLRWINLSENSFSGKIPSEFNRCSNLRAIDLNTNELSGKIPIELGSLFKLAKLRLYKNNLTESIPPSLGNLSSLEVLSLARNELEGSIPAELGRISNLGFLQISINKLSGTIPPPIYNLSSLYLFSVTANQLHGSLPQNMGFTLPNLELLFMAKNQFTGPIPISLSNASRLEEIWFTHNGLSGPVPMNLGRLQGLSILSLGGNELGESDDLSFISTLSNCSELKTLTVQVNRFGGLLPASIANLSMQLDRLAVGENRISGTIPAGIENLVNLTLLSMNQNLLTGTIPVGIGKLQQLNYLDLSQNKLSGEIPWSIGNITMQFNTLYLEGNELSGGIPWTLGNCLKLVDLNLGRNNLNGTIPKQVIGLSSLSILLDVAQNLLTGPLPLEVGNLKNLQQLYVSGNKLSGEIPNTIGDCQSLEYLHMRNNFFDGTIPSSLSNLKGIQDLDLSCNNLSGRIPKYLETFQFLENLNLSFNGLEGEVPQQGAFRNVSAISIQGNKMLCGGVKILHLPSCPTITSKKQGRSFTDRVIITITSSVLFLLLLLCFMATLYKIKKSRHISSAFSSEEVYPLVSYTELLKATDGFSSANLIGAGSYGSVYKGIMGIHRTVVAVKVLNLEQHGARRSFIAECEALRNTRHRNLVKVLTSCSSVDYSGNDFKAIVFEFMPNGSLEKWLCPKEDGQHNLMNLRFIQRLDIAIDVASALDYLHHQCGTPIVHCDLKPSNILLDDDMVAHVGDFGLSRFLSEMANKFSRNQISSIGLKGSIGYIAPEYGGGGQTSTIGDVYSYGIFLLEMFTGKRPTDDMFKDGLNLRKFTKMALPAGVMEIVDPLLLLEDEDAKDDDEQPTKTKNGFDKRLRMQECLVSVLRIGVVCSAESPRERMNMTDVASEMNVIREIFLGVGFHGERLHKVH